MRLSAKQLDALRAVEAGRVEYGAIYPNMERKAAARGESSRGIGLAFLVDGSEEYGAAKQTLPALEERGLIRTRMEDVPMTLVPERTVERRSISGGKTVHTLPEHEAPEDPGWRAPVELTDAGRAALA